MYANQSMNTDAERLYQRALKIDEKERTSVHRLAILNALGSLYHKEGKYQQAEACFKQARAMK